MIRAAIEAAADARGVDVSFDALARRTGLTKRGVLYHFPSKAALRAAIDEHLTQEWESALTAELGKSLERTTLAERIVAYARIAQAGELVPGEAAATAELVYRGVDDDDHDQRWSSWFRTWFTVPTTISAEHAGRLHAALLAVEGLWVRQAGPMALNSAEAAVVVRCVAELVEPHR